MSSHFVQLLTIGLVAFLAILLTPHTTAQAKDGNEKKFNLTGNPQIDWIHDPNLPRELGKYNLSKYPFYNRLPEDVSNFTCDNRYDGFYASIPHRCQVYHNCIFGIRYSFMCANFTVFDQANLNCQYVNMVKCEKSHLYYDENANLYIHATSSTTPRYIRRQNLRSKPSRRPFLPRPRLWGTTPKPLDDYYYEYEDRGDVDKTKKQPEYADDYYYDYAEPSSKPPPRPQRRPQRPLRPLQVDRPTRVRAPPQQEIDNTQAEIPAKRVIKEPTQIRRPNRKRVRRPGVNQPRKRRPLRRRKTTTTTTTTPEPEYYDDNEYYEDYYYYEDETTTTTTTTPAPPRRRKLRRRPVGKRTGRLPEARIRTNEASKALREETKISETPKETPVRAFGQSSRSSLIRGASQDTKLLPQESVRLTKAVKKDLEIDDGQDQKGKPIRSNTFGRPALLREGISR